MDTNTLLESLNSVIAIPIIPFNKDAIDYYSMALKALEHGAGSEKFPRNLVEPNSKKRLFLDHAYFFKKEKTEKAEALPPKTEMTTCKMNE